METRGNRSRAKLERNGAMAVGARLYCLLKTIVEALRPAAPTSKALPHLKMVIARNSY